MKLLRLAALTPLLLAGHAMAAELNTPNADAFLAAQDADTQTVAKATRAEAASGDWKAYCATSPQDMGTHARKISLAMATSGQINKMASGNAVSPSVKYLRMSCGETGNLAQ